MDSTDREQKPPKSRLQKVLLAVIILLASFIITSLCILLFITFAGQDQPGRHEGTFTQEQIPIVGICCGALYLRYFITAGLCCLVLYFLKLKSIFLQFLIFILGMVVLNLIWLRLEILFFL